MKRGWKARNKADGFVVCIRCIGTCVDDAPVYIAALGLHRIAIGQFFGRDLDYGVAVSIQRCYVLYFRRAVRAIALRHLGDSTGLQRKTDPHRGEQAE